MQGFQSRIIADDGQEVVPVHPGGRHQGIRSWPMLSEKGLEQTSACNFPSKSCGLIAGFSEVVGAGEYPRFDRSWGRERKLHDHLKNDLQLPSAVPFAATDDGCRHISIIQRHCGERRQPMGSRVIVRDMGKARGQMSGSRLQGDRATWIADC
jgi:hypothetical protein